MTPQTVTQKDLRICTHTHSLTGLTHSRTHKRIHTKLAEDDDIEYFRTVGVSGRDGQVIVIDDGGGVSGRIMGESKDWQILRLSHEWLNDDRNYVRCLSRATQWSGGGGSFKGGRS